MKKVMISAVVALVVIETIAYFLNVHPSRFSWSGFGAVQFSFALLAFFIGLVLVFIRRTNEIGKGILLAVGILLLIGYTVCSNASFNH